MYKKLVFSLLFLLLVFSPNRIYAYTSHSLKNEGTLLPSLAVALENGTATTTEIGINGTIANVTATAIIGTQDYVDNNVSDVDSSDDKGTQSNFTTQKYSDGIYDILTEDSLLHSNFNASSVTTVAGTEVAGDYTNITDDDGSYMVWDSDFYSESGSPYLSIMVSPLEKGTQMWYIWTIVNPTDDVYNVTEVRFNTTIGTDMLWLTITAEYPTSGWIDGGTAGLYWSNGSGEIIDPHDHKRFACKTTTDDNAKVTYTAIWSFIANGTGYSRQAWTYEGDRVSQGGIFWNLADNITEQTVANTQTNGDYLNASVDSGSTELQPNTEYSFLINLAEWGGQTNGWDIGGTLTITIPKEFTDVELITITEFSDAVLNGGGAEDWIITGTNDAYIDLGVASLVFNVTTPAYYDTQSNWVLDGNYTGYCTKNNVDIEVHGEYAIRIAEDTNQVLEYTATRMITTTYASIVNIILTYNSKYNVSSGTQSLYAYNYDKGAYDLFNQTTPQTSDFNVIYILLNNSYVDSSDGYVLFKLVTAYTSPFNHSGDFLEWNINHWDTVIVAEAPDGTTVYDGSVVSGSYLNLASDDGSDYVLGDGATSGESNGVELAVQSGPIEKGTEGWHSWVVINYKDTQVTCTGVAFDEVETPDTDWGWILTDKVPTETWSDNGIAGVNWTGSVDIPAHSAAVWKLFFETETEGTDEPLTFNWTATVTGETVETVQLEIVTQDRISWGGIFWNLPDDTSDRTEADVLADKGNYTYMDETYDNNPIYGQTQYLFKFSVQEWGGQTNGFDIGGDLSIVIPKEFTDVSLADYDDFSDAAVTGGGASDWLINATNDAYIDNGVAYLSFYAKPPSTYSGYSDWILDAEFAGYCTKDACDIWLYGQGVVRVAGPYHKISWKGYVTTSETVSDILNIEIAYDGSYNVSTVNQVLTVLNQTGNSWYEWNSTSINTSDVLCTQDLYSLNYSMFINSTGFMEIMVNTSYYTDAPLQIEADRIQWNLTVKTYKLNLEMQWLNANYTRSNEELCIFAETFSGSEDIMTYAWNVSTADWQWVMNLTANQWNNISVTDWLNTETFTIRFLGGTESSDTNQDSWQIDCSLLHTWTNGSTYDYVLSAVSQKNYHQNISLNLYDYTNIERLTNCTVWFHDSTTSVQIEIIDGSIISSTGAWYNLTAFGESRIALFAEESNSGTSILFIKLEAVKGNSIIYENLIKMIIN